MSSDYQLEDTLYLPFTTRAFATGIPTVLVSGAVDIYEDVTATPIVTGDTLAVSLNSVVGFNMITVTATAGTGFEAGKSYTAILQAGTVDGVSVVGEVVAHFTIGKSPVAKDWIDGGRLDLLLDAILLDTGTTLDGKIDTIGTDTAATQALAVGATGFAAIDTVVDAVKVKTDQMVFTTANQLDTQTISMATNSMTADAAATDFIGAAELAAAASQEIADLIAADWVAGDASPLAIVSALKADAEWTNLATLATAVTTVDTVVDGIQTDLSNATDGLGAIKTDTAAILIDTAEIGAAGAGLTDLGGMATAMKAEVNAEVLDVLNVDTFAEPGQGAPLSTTSLAAKIGYLFKYWRNRKSNDGDETTLYADDATTADQQQTVVTGNGEVSLEEWATGA